uniref:Uncharacterized protein n=1 Tax=Cucumis melo TaxID=3656 RepID=A0A9I9EA72_CUCME
MNFTDLRQRLESSKWDEIYMKSNFQILHESAKVLSNQPTLNRKFLRHDGGNLKNRRNDIPRLCFFDDLLHERCVQPTKDAYSPPLFLIFVNVDLIPIQSFHLPEGGNELEFWILSQICRSMFFKQKTS